MNPIEQQIAIAESVGWRKICSNDAVVYVKDADLVSYQARTQEQLPNYLKDLNAMHEVENAFYKRAGMYEFERYLTHLQHIMNRVPPVQENMFFVSAPAAQRAEAYLRTIGKWRD